MNTQYELVELLTYLETNEIGLYKEIKTAIFENLSKSKEPWLVNAVVDMFVASNSSRCLDVLVSINEPHDKHLFERLNDHMKSSQRLRALAILAHLVQHEPVWLHKIISVQLMPTMLRSLKVESDGLILLTGALVLTGILPIVPVSIAPFLNDICEVFGALAALCLNRSGNVPEVYLLHLQVGLHCMFNRLYSMYPWHLLTYLRGAYSRPENVAVFENVIKPMLSLVRMHPLLVMGSKEKETSRERWKEKEVHDIIVECAQLSLDPFDREFVDGRNLLGSWPDKRQQRLSRPDGNQDFSWISLLSSSKISASESGSADNLWSPSKQCGLYAPSVGSIEATEKGHQTTSQGGSSNVSSQGSAVSLQLITDGTPKETVSDVSLKSDESSVEPGAKAAAAAVIPPLMVEPPTPPDVNRGAENKAPCGFFGVRLPPDGSVSLDEMPANPQNPIGVVTLAASESVGPSEAEVSTAAMAALMKKMKRIRLNSINISRGDQKTSLPQSRSCPHLLSPTLYSLPGPAEDDDRLTSSQGSLDGSREGSGSDKWNGPLTKSSLELAVAPIVSRASPVAVATVSTESQTGFYVFSPRTGEHTPEGRAEPESEGTEGEADPSTEGVHPFELMLGLVLPFAPFVQCYSCMRKHWDDIRAGKQCSTGNQRLAENQSLAKHDRHSTPKLDCITPLFMTYSPSSLLDRHIQQSYEMHAKGLSVKATLSSSQIKSAAAASSASSVSDAVLLRGQVLLMHNQLMFERRRQGLHAKRNRRLLGRTVKVVSLEEQNTAMRDQLRLQESEMAKLRSDLQFCRNQMHSLEETIRHDGHKFNEIKRSYTSEVESLKLRLKESEESLASQKSTNEQLVQQLERTNNKMFAKEKDLELLRLKVESLSHLERQVIQLNTELLLMGELHQKYQQRLSEMSVKPQTVRPQLQMCLDSCKEECHGLRMQMKEKTVALEDANARMEAILSQHHLQEKNVAELKNQLEQSQTLHLEHMQILEERYKNEKKTQQALQSRILELQAEVELLKKKQPARAPQRPTHSTAIVSGTGTDPEPAASTGLAAEPLRVASDHPSDHSITDSPAHPGQK